MHRVVVTGMGVISPVGNSTESFFQNLVNGVSGIGPITRFDTTDYKVKLAGEVKDFDTEIRDWPAAAIPSRSPRWPPPSRPCAKAA